MIKPTTLHENLKKTWKKLTLEEPLIFAEGGVAFLWFDLPEWLKKIQGTKRGRELSAGTFEIRSLNDFLLFYDLRK